MGPRPKLEHPGRTLRRVVGYLMKLYGLQMAVVVVLIFVGVLANVQGTMFMQTLIDDYIMPMLGQEHPDFGPLERQSAGWPVFMRWVWPLPLFTTRS